MKTFDLRVRVAAAVAITCFAVVGALALTLYTASEELEETLVDQIVSEEMDFLIQHHREHPGIAREPGPNVRYYVVRNAEDVQRVPEALRLLGVGSHEIGQGMDEQHVAVRIVDGTRFVVAYDAGPHEIREQQFKRLILFALVTIMFAAAAIGYWVSGLITRQITGLAAEVADLDPGAPRGVLARDGQDPEVAALAGAFDQYQTRIREMIEREQEFTGNASHELRTPLTAIRTSCELLDTEPGLTDKARSRIADIAAAAERMTGQIEMLLFLSRALPVDARQPLDLAECIHAAIAPWRGELERKGLRFDNGVAPGTTVRVNGQALNLVLANLLRNAVRYTMRGGIRVDWLSPTLTVTDSGPGVPPDQRERLFERHYRGTSGADGFGLGLAIVKRVCEHCHWHIDVTAAETGGSSFRLTLA